MKSELLICFILNLLTFVSNYEFITDNSLTKDPTGLPPMMPRVIDTIYFKRGKKTISKSIAIKLYFFFIMIKNL